MAEEKHTLSPELLEMGGIILKYLQKDISPEQEALLKSWVSRSEHNKKLLDELQDNDSLIAEMKRYNESIERTEGARSKVVEDLFPKNNQVQRMTWYRYVAAAVLLALLGGGYFWYFNARPHNDKKEAIVTNVQNDVEPGRYKAKLTLGDGSVVVLDSFSSSKIVQQGSTTIYSRDGQLVYEQKGKDHEVLYNTLTTAKGETYGMLLSDGSKVWLNSQSSLRYPVAFSNDERRVEITGEAYFEVAPFVALLANGQTGKRPFIVDVNGMEVEVLGTHFNINSYLDEDAIKATLLEGKVRVRSVAINAQAILKPGDQAILRRGQDNKIAVVKDVDVDAEVAWRFGYFQFVNADLKTVMHQLERWYDVEVVYQGNVSNDLELIGKIPRSMNLSKVLDVLQTQQVHFKIEGHKIIVLP